MLVKDTKGRVLTDVHGRPMTNKDRWHPLVISFIKRVTQDGGKIITPAIEEMNADAWAGKFNDALYVYYAAARKAGKTYALIGNDPTIERDSVAYEVGKYRLFGEIVNDMPEIAFDPETGVFKGVANREQVTNLIENSALPQVENIATTVQSYTISFYGTGSYELSGSHTATIDGTGEFERTTLTFTPSAGTLTIIPSGDINYPQLVEGTNAGGIVVTNGSIATRLADNFKLQLENPLPDSFQLKMQLDIPTYSGMNSGSPVLFSLQSNTPGEYNNINLSVRSDSRLSLSARKNNQIVFNENTNSAHVGKNEIEIIMNAISEMMILLVNGIQVLEVSFQIAEMPDDLVWIGLGSRINPFAGFNTDRQLNSTVKSLIIKPL